MKISTGGKIAIVAVAAGIGWHLYKLYQAGNAITYGVKGIKFRREKLKLFLDVTFGISNPTKTEINVKGIGGQLKFADNLISTFTGPGAIIKPGETPYTTTFAIDNLGVITTILSSVAQKQWPVFDIKMKTALPLFSVSESYAVNTKDYADQIKGSLGIA